jgi:hypothetical protein
MSQSKGVERRTDAMRASTEPPAADGASKGRDQNTSRMKPQVQEHIGRQLRAVYDDVLKQPLPDRFRELMEKLDQKMGEPE